LPTVQARAVRRAAEILGDDVLAVRLGVSHERLHLWMHGVVRPPESVFLQVVDIIGDHDLQALRNEVARTPPGSSTTPGAG
jgi:hypothetical protein